MPDIKHYLVVDTPNDKVYDAVTTKEGIAGWWTKDVNINPEVDSIANFNFGEFKNEMRITNLEKNKLVEWHCIKGDKEWIDTTFKFIINKKEGKTHLKFEHNKWNDYTEFFAMCNYNWGWYLTSLKNYCEKGKGTPYPESIEK